MDWLGGDQLTIFDGVCVQPQSMEELTTEAVQDDVEIQNDGQTDAFAVSYLILIFELFLLICLSTFNVKVGIYTKFKFELL